MTPDLCRTEEINKHVGMTHVCRIADHVSHRIGGNPPTGKFGHVARPMRQSASKDQPMARRVA